MTSYEAGDRIEVIGVMVNDPSPMEVGATGTVVAVNADVGQMWVDWDNGRKLMVLLPGDLGVIRRRLP